MTSPAVRRWSGLQPPVRLTDTVLENTYTDRSEGTAANNSAATLAGTVEEAEAVASSG